jgi:adenylate cyclase
LRRPGPVGLGIALAAFLAVSALRATGLLQAIELAVYDAYLKLRPEGGWVEERVAVIRVTDEDIHRLGHWPLSDDVLAEILEALLAHAPRSVGIDLYRDLPVPPGTERFERTLAAAGSVVFINKFGGPGAAHVPPPRVLAGTERVGFADLLVDPGGIVRRGLLFLDDGETLGYSLGLRLALLYLAPRGVFPVAGEPDPGHLRLGEVTLRPLEPYDGPYTGADAAGYQFLLDWRGGPAPFTTYTLSDLLGGRVPAGALRDRVVLLGVSADSVKDLFLTPYSRRGESAIGTPMVMVHAHAVSQLLRAGLDGERPLGFLPEWAEYLFTLLWALIGAVTAFRVRALPLFSTAALIHAAALIGGTLSAFVSGWWLPVLPMGLAALAAATLAVAYLSGHERAERRFLMEIFAKQVSPDVAEEMWRERDQFLTRGRLEPRTLTATVLFTDLHNFTPVAERLPPQELMGWLNHYMETMAGLVMAHGGVVDDYYGDAIKANFGVPIPRADGAAVDEDARRAVHCALAMSDALELMNIEWSTQGLPRITMRVGIATGPVVAGCLGSAARMKFTTIGDVVNTAARLESYGKDDPTITAEDCTCRILISGETARRLGDGTPTERVGTLYLKGKDAGVEVHRVRAAAADVQGADRPDDSCKREQVMATVPPAAGDPARVLH